MFMSLLWRQWVVERTKRNSEPSSSSPVAWREWGIPAGKNQRSPGPCPSQSAQYIVQQASKGTYDSSYVVLTISVYSCDLSFSLHRRLVNDYWRIGCRILAYLEDVCPLSWTVGSAHLHAIFRSLFLPLPSCASGALYNQIQLTISCKAFVRTHRMAYFSSLFSEVHYQQSVHSR